MSYRHYMQYSLVGSPTSSPCMASNSTAKSQGFFAMGPAESKYGAKGTNPVRDTGPTVGLSPYKADNKEGNTMEPSAQKSKSNTQSRDQSRRTSGVETYQCPSRLTSVRRDRSWTKSSSHGHSVPSRRTPRRCMSGIGIDCLSPNCAPTVGMQGLVAREFGEVRFADD